MSEMVERVARAIEVALEDSNIRDDGLTASAGMAVARAAIKAMRDPTREMQAAFNPAYSEGKHLREVWAGMIDAALK